MSNLTTHLRLKPPIFGQYEENLYSKGHMCPRCHGRGLVSVADDMQTDSYGLCPVCAGTGALDAEITIKWKPQKVM